MLVALVVTIVVLLILAGITITYVLGDNSVFKQAQNAKLQTEIAKAREKIEVTFGHAQLLKHTDKKYDQDDYLDDLMGKEIPDIEIKGDIVTVDGYVFEIDRNEPKIGQYVGKKSELVFPEITVNVTLAEDKKTAVIHITAKENKNGISKIEIIQGGYVLETYECENTKEEVVKDYTAKQNGTYTIKVHAGLTTSEKAKVEGVIASVEYSPNGNEDYKKEHKVAIKASEDVEKVKSIKYQWLKTTVEPEADTFTETCSNNTIITGKGYTGTYYLWTLVETESGKTKISRSEAFNFDNQGPDITYTVEYVSESSFKILVNSEDNYSNVSGIKLEKDGVEIARKSEASLAYTESAENVEKSFVVTTVDDLGNEKVEKLNILNNIFAWKKYEIATINKWTYGNWSVWESFDNERFNYIQDFYTDVEFDPINGPTGVGERHPACYWVSLVGNYSDAYVISGSSVTRYYNFKSFKDSDGDWHVTYNYCHRTGTSSASPGQGAFLGIVLGNTESKFTNGVNGDNWYERITK